MRLDPRAERSLNETPARVYLILLAPSILSVPEIVSNHLSDSNAASVRANEVLDFPRFHVTVTYRSSHFHSGASVLIQGDSQPRTKVLRRSSCPLQDSSSAYLIATKPQPFWASPKRLCNEWHAAERSPASKLGIFGAFVLPLSTTGSPPDSLGSPKTT